MGWGLIEDNDLCNPFQLQINTSRAAWSPFRLSDLKLAVVYPPDRISGLMTVSEQKHGNAAKTITFCFKEKSEKKVVVLASV